MSTDMLIQARKRAERAVEGMEEGPLKVAAFQTILAKLISDAAPSDRTSAEVGTPRASVKQPGSLRGRVLTIKAGGFFKAQRGLGEVREELGSRGWHYPVTTLSGVMQGLVRQREL